MILHIDFQSSQPLYMQLRDQVVVAIADGKLSPGEHLPTIRALAEESGINMMTVSKAYQLLKQDVYKRQPPAHAWQHRPGTQPHPR